MTPMVSTETLMMMEVAIPMTEMIWPFSVPGSTPAETCAMLAQGTRMLEMLPERKAM